jgi:hypothetical protein
MTLDSVYWLLDFDWMGWYDEAQTDGLVIEDWSKDILKKWI